VNITRKNISIGILSLTGVGALAACGYVKVFNGSGSEKITWTAEQGYQTGNDTISDTEAVAACVANFPSSPFTFATGDSIENVNGSFSAPTSQDDCTVTWSKSDELSWVQISAGSISVTPAESATNQTGTLTATISRQLDSGASNTSKTYGVTVKRLLQSAEVDACAAAISSTDITFANGDTAAGVTSDFTLPSTKSMGSYSCSVTWSEVLDNNNAIAIAGGLSATISRPSYATGNASVTLKATVSSAGYSKDSSNVSLTVTKLAITDADALVLCKADLDLSDVTGVTGISGTNGEVASGINSVTLPTTISVSGTSCSVSWASSDTNHISISGATGTVTHGHTPGAVATDTSVVLTPTITKAALNDSTKTFTLAVKPHGTINVGNSGITIGSSGAPVFSVFSTNLSDSDGGHTSNIRYKVCVAPNTSIALNSIASIISLSAVSACSGDSGNPFMVSDTQPTCCTASSVAPAAIMYFSVPLSSGQWNSQILGYVNTDPDISAHKFLYTKSPPIL
jgi:hypothetical protein